MSNGRETKDGRPYAGLTRDALRELDQMEPAIKRAKADLEAFDELGLDTTALKEKLAWGEKAIEIIRKRFSE